VIKGQRTVSVDMLQDYLLPQMKNAAAETVSHYAIGDLKTSMRSKDELATAIEAHLNDTMKSIGLTFGGVKAIEFRHERWDAMAGPKKTISWRLPRRKRRLPPARLRPGWTLR